MGYLWRKKMPAAPQHITCRVKAYRQSKGWSQARLAHKIGIKRQAVYDIESGRYLPNTAVALKLARQFGCRVENLFVDESARNKEPVVMVEKSLSPRISTARIRGRLVGFPLDESGVMADTLTSADAILSDTETHAELLCPPALLEKTILLMGCDPAFGILSAHMGRSAADCRLHSRFATSHLALKRLGQGYTHIAGSHLHNTGSHEANVTAASRKLPEDNGMVVGFSTVEEGLVVARGNPLKIRGIHDLTRSDVRFVNRDAGAALRVLLDDLLRKAAIPNTAVNGYENMVYSHTQGAWKVRFGIADAALGLRVIAHAFDMDFLPLDAVRCDLVIPADMMELSPVKVMLDILQTRIFQKELRTIPGYDTGMTGKIIARLNQAT